MKLKRKLLPIIGASAGIGATALALTGCSFFIGGDDSSWVNVMKRYVPSGYEQHKYAECNENAALDEYVKQLEQHEDTFIQDFYWFASNALVDMQKEIQKKDTPARKTNSTVVQKGMNFPGQTMAAKRDKIKLLDFDYVPYTFTPSEDPSNPIHLMKVSYTYEYTYEFEQTEQAKEGKITTNKKLVGKTTLTNMPYVLQYNPRSCLWAVRPSRNLLLNEEYLYAPKTDNVWGIDVEGQNVTTEIIESDIYGKFTMVDTMNIEKVFDGDDISDYSDDDKEYVEELLNQDGWCYSWFMYNVNIKK